MVELTNSFSSEWRDAIAPAIREWWTPRARVLLRIAILMLAVYAALKLGDEVRRMIWDFEEGSAWDLKFIQREVVQWFSGRPVYAEMDTAVYPPASLVLFYPFLGWLPLDSVRWLWMAATAAAIIWLIWLLARYTGVAAPSDRAMIALFLLAMNSTGVAFGIGQWILFILPFLLVGLFTLQDPVSWRRDLVVAGCLIAALAKPSISAPFLWLALFSPGGWRVLGLVTLGYGGLSLYAVSFQSAPLTVLFRDWIVQISSIAATQGYGNVSTWVSNLGFGEWSLFASLLVFLSIGLWAYRHRHSDLWLLLGIVALASRLWTYHQFADDVLILFPLIALFRIASRGRVENGNDVTAGLLLAAMMLFMLLPAQMLSFPSPWNFPFSIGHPLIWTIGLAFLLIQAQIKKRNSLDPTNYQAAPLKVG